jgi:RecA/RadA recombinase
VRPGDPALTPTPAPAPGRFGLRLVPADAPSRRAAKPLGVPDTDPHASFGSASSRGRRELVGLGVAEARHHLHVLGPTGTGKSTLLLRLVLAEAAAGRGVVVVDPHGDLAVRILERLPVAARDRLVLIDPDETVAPPSWNVLDCAPGGGELVTEHLVATLHRLYAPWWGPRLEDTLRAACLTLTHPATHPSSDRRGRGGATLVDIPRLLTQSGFRARVTAGVRRVDPGGLGAFWDAYDALTPAQAAMVGGPVLSKLRAITSRAFAVDLLGAAPSTIDMGAVLDGGILIARLPKGILGEDTTRLVGSLLLTGLWQAATARTGQPEQARLDASVVVDECHNFLHLPIGLDDALAEARSYRVSWVLAHQHLGQLPATMGAAIDANARNKVYFALSPADAHVLAKHTVPHLDETDLAGLDGYQIACRLMVGSRSVRPFTLATLPPAPALPGGLAAARAAARTRGLPRAARAEHAARRRRLESLSGQGIQTGSPAQSPAHSLAHPPAPMQWGSDWATPDNTDPQVTPENGGEGRVRD